MGNCKKCGTESGPMELCAQCDFADITLSRHVAVRKSSDIAKIGPKTAGNISMLLEVPEYGGDYHQAIIDSAKVLCKAHKPTAQYQEQWSGTTYWEWYGPDGSYSEPEYISVAQDGTIGD